MTVRRLCTEIVSNSTHLNFIFFSPLVKQVTLHSLWNTPNIELINGCPSLVRASCKEDYIPSSHIHTHILKIQLNIILSSCLDSGIEEHINKVTQHCPVRSVSSLFCLSFLVYQLY